MLIDLKKLSKLGYKLTDDRFYVKEVAKGIRAVIQVEPNSNKVVSRYYKIYKFNIIKGDDLDFITQTFNDFRNDYLTCIYKEEQKLLSADEVSWLRVFLGNMKEILLIERAYENNVVGLKFYDKKDESFFVPVLNGFSKLELHRKYEIKKLLW